MSDVIVVGGGHNGLTAAAYLAAAGLSVTVLERRPIVGGFARRAQTGGRVGRGLGAQPGSTGVGENEVPGYEQGAGRASGFARRDGVVALAVADAADVEADMTITLDEAARRAWSIVVVGAGPAGATAALELARRGVHPLAVSGAGDAIVGGLEHAVVQGPK